MLNAEVIERTQRYLFADVEEMKAAGLPSPVRERMVRLRDMYNYWLHYTRLSERDVVREIVRRYEIRESMAYEDVRLIKTCLGNLNQCTKDYDAYRFRMMCEETYAMARRQGDTLTMQKVANSYGKFTRLDRIDPEAPSYDEIVPEPFEMSGDPTLIGIKPVANWREKAKRLEAKLFNQIEEADFTEEPDTAGKPLRPEDEKRRGQP